MDVKGGAGEIKDSFAVLDAKGVARIIGVDRDANGRLYVSGAFSGSSEEGSGPGVIVARMKADDQPDSDYGSDGHAEVRFKYADFYSSIHGLAMLLEPDGGVVVMVRSTSSGLSVVGLARFGVDGELDTSFGDGGVIVHQYPARTMGEQPFSAAEPGELDALNRGDASGGGCVRLASGKILYAAQPHTATTGPAVISRFLSNGQRDTDFGTRGDGTVEVSPPGYESHFNFLYGVTELPDGRIVACGNVGKFNGGGLGNPKCVVVRCNEDGGFDPSFDGDGFVLVDYPDNPSGTGIGVFRFRSIAVGVDGAVILGGESSSNIEGVRSYHGIVHKLASVGSPDKSFNNGKMIVFGADGQARIFQVLGFQDDRKIVLGGYAPKAPTPPTEVDCLVARFDIDGGPDVSFARQGWRTFALRAGYNEVSAMLVETDLIVLGVTQGGECAVVNLFA